MSSPLWVTSRYLFQLKKASTAVASAQNVSNNNCICVQVTAANKFLTLQLVEQYTAANNEHAEAKTTLTKCEHDLKSQDTVLGEIKAAVEAAKKQNSDI